MTALRADAVAAGARAGLRPAATPPSAASSTTAAPAAAAQQSTKHLSLLGGGAAALRHRPVRRALWLRIPAAECLDASLDGFQLLRQPAGLCSQLHHFLIRCGLHRRCGRYDTPTRPGWQAGRVVHVAPAAAAACAIAHASSEPGHRVGEPGPVIAGTPAGATAGHRAGPHRSCAISPWHDVYPFPESCDRPEVSV